MLQILSVTIPFFALVLGGYVVARRRWMPLEAIPGLNTFVLFFALPCMLYRFGANSPVAMLLDAGVVAVYLLAAAGVVALTLLFTRRGRVGWNDAAFGALVAAFPNSGFIGVPLVADLLGSRAAGPAIVSLTLDMVFTTSLCVALSRLGTAEVHGIGRAVVAALRGVFSNPLPWAIVAGAVAAATGFELPGPVKHTVGMLADAASPVALFTLGAMLARAQINAARREAAIAPGGRRPWGDVPEVAVFKLLLHPALVFGIGHGLRALGVPLDGFSLTVLVLVAALPGASNVTMLAERYGADSGRIARIVMLTTGVSFVTFTAIVSLLVGSAG